MARAQSIKRRKSAKSSSLSEALQAFTARRIMDGAALTTFMLGAFILLSLISYHHSDPSLNTAGSADDIGNWMGLSGAWTADLLLQTLGAGAFAIALVFMIWGVRILKRQEIGPLWARFISLFTGCLLASIALAQIPAGEWGVHSTLGASTGALLLNAAVTWGQALAPGLGHTAFTATAALIGFAVILYAAAIRLEEIATVLKLIRYALISLFVFVFNAIAGFYAWLRRYNEADYSGPN